MPDGFEGSLLAYYCSSRAHIPLARSALAKPSYGCDAHAGRERGGHEKG
jgi:hypothetical protein